MTEFMCECLEEWADGGTYPKWIHLHSITRAGSIYINCSVHNKGRWFN